MVAMMQECKKFKVSGRWPLTAQAPRAEGGGGWGVMEAQVVRGGQNLAFSSASLVPAAPDD